MTLTFEQTIDDLLSLRMLNEKEKKFNMQIRFGVLMVIMLFAVAAIGYIIYKNPAKADPSNLIFATFMLVFIGVMRSPWIYKYRMKSSISKEEERKFVGEKTFVFKENYIQTITANTRSEIAWDQFTNMKETDDHLYIFLSSAKALIIPKRIFLLEQELYDVKSFIERKLGLQKSK